MDIWDYLKSYKGIKEDNPEKLDAFVKSAGGELVPLHTVALAIDDLSEDVGRVIGQMVTVQEQRFRELVAELPEDIQTKIKQKFDSEGDDLFAEGEQ